MNDNMKMKNYYTYSTQQEMRFEYLYIKLFTTTVVLKQK